MRQDTMARTPSYKSADGKYLTDEPTNCVMLCHDCHHNVVHGNLKKYRPILLDIASNIYGIDIYAGPQKG